MFVVVVDNDLFLVHRPVWKIVQWWLTLKKELWSIEKKVKPMFQGYLLDMQDLTINIISSKIRFWVFVTENWIFCTQSVTWCDRYSILYFYWDGVLHRLRPVNAINFFYRRKAFLSRWCFFIDHYSKGHHILVVSDY